MKKILVLTVRFVTTLNKPANIFLLFSISGIFFWSEFTHWYSSPCKKNPILSKYEIMYGVLNSFCLTLNRPILIGKYFLYILLS